MIPYLLAFLIGDMVVILGMLRAGRVRQRWNERAAARQALAALDRIFGNA